MASEQKEDSVCPFKAFPGSAVYHVGGESRGRARLRSVGGHRVISRDARFQPTVPSRVELCIQPRVDSLNHSNMDRIRLE